MLFLDLPDELLLLVGEVIPLQRDLSSLTKTNRRLYCLLSDLLLKINMQDSNSSALVYAAQHGNLAVVQRMVELGAEINATNPDAYTVLDCAASEGHVDIVRYLLKKGASHRFTVERPCTPLCTAAAAGHADVVRVFLDHHEPEPSEKQDDQSESLVIPGVTAFNVSQRTVQNMFTMNVSKTEQETLEYTIPLFLAILHSHDEAALSLIEDQRVNINYRDLWGRTPLMWALTCGRRKLVRALLQHGADANVHDEHSGLTVLITEIRRPKARHVRLLLAHNKVDPNLPDRHSCTPFWAALDSWDVTMLKQLLSRPDLDVNRPRNGITPLLHAISNKQEDVAILLLKHPSLDSTSINSMDPNERTPLSYASEYGQVWLTDMLLEKGADPQLADVDGRVPRSYAAARIESQPVTSPTQTGQAVTDSGEVHAQAPIFLAIHHGHLDTLETLVNMGADPSQQNEDGHTPLHCLVKRSGRQPVLAPEDEQAIRFLLQHGADPRIKDNCGMTALDMARVYGWGELMGGILRSSFLSIRGEDGRGSWEDANIPPTSEGCAAAGVCWTKRRTWRVGVGYESDWVESREPWRV
ncbi:ankyrin repeat domain-containing protein [Aspergillus foveolatus]|uniref:ankyrin repeat domain-containing protein n=1 Tax=Aspergillus foveolatus TaxID=210207 RepID=UPI003CCD927C